MDRGPIDSRTWPTQLDGHAVSPVDRRLFGYDVERDVAAFYRFSDVLFLSLVGELPDDSRSRAFEIALCFAMPVSVAHAAVHAAALARLCGARPSGVLSASGLIFGEEATALVEATNQLLSELESGDAELPPLLRSTSEADRQSVARLASLLEGVLEVPILRSDPGRDVAILAVLRRCGVTSAFALAALVALARLPSALAEAVMVRPGDFPTYPLDTPHFEYVEGPAARSVP